MLLPGRERRMVRSMVFRMNRFFIRKIFIFALQCAIGDNNRHNTVSHNGTSRVSLQAFLFEAVSTFSDSRIHAARYNALSKLKYFSRDLVKVGPCKDKRIMNLLSNRNVLYNICLLHILTYVL